MIPVPYECIQIDNVVVVVWGHTMNSSDIEEVLTLVGALAAPGRRLVYIGWHPRAMAVLSGEARATLFAQFHLLLMHCDCAYIVHEKTRLLGELRSAYLRSLMSAGRAVGLTYLDKVKVVNSIEEALIMEADNLSTKPVEIMSMLRRINDKL